MTQPGTGSRLPAIVLLDAVARDNLAMLLATTGRGREADPGRSRGR